MTFADDSKINGLQMSMLTAIMDNDPAAFLRAHRAAGPIAESYLHNLPEGPVELTEKVPVFPLPEWMGLKGVGFRATEPFLVAAPPGNGKSMFCANLAAYLIKAKARVTIFVNEGRTQDYVIQIYRILQAILPPPSSRHLSKDDCYTEKPVIADWLKGSGLRIVDVRTDGPRELLARMVQTMSKRKSDVILFDWLQKVKVMDHNKKFEAFAYLASKFEDLCLEWKIPIGVFGQINRESMRDKKFGAPGLGSLYGCPDMENVAGLCIYLKNGLTNAGESYRGPSFLWANVAKHRDGSVGERTIRVDYRSQSFDGQLDPDQIEEFISHLKSEKKRTA